MRRRLREYRWRYPQSPVTAWRTKIDGHVKRLARVPGQEVLITVVPIMVGGAYASPDEPGSLVFA